MLDQFTSGFAAQFAPDGDGYLYRKRQKAAPVRVSAEERDRFVADFGRWFRYSFFGLIAAFLAVSVLTLVLAFYWGLESIGWNFLLLAVVLIPYVWMTCWMWNAPDRATAGRPALGEARSGEEMRRIGLRSLSYKWMALMALFGVYQVANYFLRPDLFSGGWDAVRLVMALVLLAVVAVQGFRKYRVERAG